jgi:hypothetical protein
MGAAGRSKREKLLGRSVATLQKDRLRGNGPPFIKVGRLSRYRPSGVRARLDDHTRQSTSDQDAAKDGAA